MSLNETEDRTQDRLIGLADRFLEVLESKAQNLDGETVTPIELRAFSEALNEAYWFSINARIYASNLERKERSWD